MHVIGTAGHVDHGKSALVKALTGTDPDRFEEEKRRGLTIDLGFAWMKLSNGDEVAIVDVPGHERFIKNMLAGAGSIDCALFVVAANEGWKPQSQEHLDVLDLLGVTNAVVAVTKADLVDGSQLARVTDDVRSRLSRTGLSGARLVAVSSSTMSGVQELMTEIEHLLVHAPVSPDQGRARLWIDRVFTIKGSGTVVTGTLLGGGLSVGDEVEILPSGTRARIRVLQSHGRTVETAGPGNRVAANLAGIGTDETQRGQVLARPAEWRATDTIGVALTFLQHLGFDPSERGAFKLYVGSAELEARLKLLPDGLAIVRLSEPRPIDVGDRFILRDSGRRMTIGGGVVVDPHLDRGIRSTEQYQRIASRGSGDRSTFGASLLREKGAMTKTDLRRLTGLEPGSLSDAIELPTLVFDSRHMEDLVRAFDESIGEHHQEHPLEPGMPLGDLRAAVGLAGAAFDEALGFLESSGHVVVSGGFAMKPGHRPRAGTAESAQLLQYMHEAGSSPPALSEIRTRFGQDLVRSLIRTGDLVEISPGLAYPSSWLDQMKASLRRAIDQEGPVTVARFRDLIGASRKYAVPLMEYLDRTGFTSRRGDHRVLGPKA